jgi:hypothetical protein
MALGIITGVVVSQSGVTLFARVIGITKEPITQDTVSDVTYGVRDLTDGETDVSSSSLSVVDCIHNDLVQDDPRWTRDNQWRPGPDGLWGYNLEAVLPSTLFTDYDMDTDTKEISRHRFRVDLKINPRTGQPMVIPFEFTPIETYVS